MSTVYAITMKSILAITLVSACSITVLSQHANGGPDAVYGRQSLVQLQALSAATAQYAEIFDETLPLAFGRRPDQTHAWGSLHYVPANWASGPGNDPGYPNRSVYSPQHWANLILPYLGSTSYFDSPGLRTLESYAVDPERNSVRAARVGYTYNGLLHQLSLSSVGNPDRLTLFWHGYGNVHLPGLGMSQPSLSCPVSTQPCRFQPSGTSCNNNGECTVMFIFNRTAWVYNKTSNFVSVGGVAEPVRMAVLLNGFTNPNNDPWAQYSIQGLPQSFWLTGSHSRFFRPDRVFN